MIATSWSLPKKPFNHNRLRLSSWFTLSAPARAVLCKNIPVMIPSHQVSVASEDLGLIQVSVFGSEWQHQLYHTQWIVPIMSSHTKVSVAFNFQSHDVAHVKASTSSQHEDRDGKKARGAGGQGAIRIFQSMSLIILLCIPTSRSTTFSLPSSPSSLIPIT